MKRSQKFLLILVLLALTLSMALGCMSARSSSSFIVNNTARVNGTKFVFPQSKGYHTSVVNNSVTYRYGPTSISAKHGSLFIAGKKVCEYKRGDLVEVKPTGDVYVNNIHQTKFPATF